MKIAFRIFLCVCILGCFRSNVQAQIVNSIAYYQTVRGNCGLPTFAPDSLYNANLSGGTGPYTFIWEKSLDGTNFTPITGPQQGHIDYLPDPITQITWFRRTVISGVDTSHSLAYEFYTNLSPIQGNIISSNKSTTIPCGSTSYDPGTLTSLDPLIGGVTNNDGFQWFRSTDGVNFKQVPFANLFSYSPGIITTDTWFKRVVFSPHQVCVDSSNVLHFTFAGLQGNTISSPPVNSSCSSSSFSPGQIVGSNPGAGTVYQWQTGTDTLHFLDISGTNSQNYTPPTLTTSTYFRRKATLNICYSYSNPILFSVSAPLSGDTISASQLIDSSTAPSALIGNLVTAGTSTVKYQWEFSTDSINYAPAFGNSTGINYQPLPLVKKTYFRRKAYIGQCYVYSNIVIIRLNPKVIIPPPPPSGCPNGVTQANLGVTIINRPNNKSIGSQYDYSIAVTNYSPSAATNVVVKDTLPKILEYIPANNTLGTITYDGATHVLTWTISKIPALATYGFIITVNPTVNDQIINKVTVSAKECDPFEANNHAADTLNDPIPVLLASSLHDIITPNGDGYNDVFKIDNFLGVQGLTNNELLIFDRWGNTVFHTKSYQNDWAGNGLSAGTYFYVLRINNGTRSQTFKGHITLLR